MTRPRRTVDTPPTSGTPAVAYSAICHTCGRAYISVIREFPVPYICPGCRT